METDHTAGSPTASVALAAALILIVVGVVTGQGDPDMMSLSVLPVIIVGAIAYMVTNSHGTAYRSAVGVALAAAFIFFWMIGAVGLMGTDDEHPADLMYIVVPMVGITGAIIARFQPRGMARAMVATALAQMSVPAIAVIAGLNLVPISPTELISFTSIVNGPFAALYVGSALLFRKAARGNVQRARRRGVDAHGRSDPPPGRRGPDRSGAGERPVQGVDPLAESAGFTRSRSTVAAEARRANSAMKMSTVGR